MPDGIRSAATVGVPDAAARLTELLERVERGEDVLIARDGRPVARLSRADTPEGDVAAARKAADELMELRERIGEEAGEPFSLAEILALRDEGRRR